MACGEHSACQIWSSIGLEPANVIYRVPALLLQGKAAGIDGMVSPGNPQGAIRFQNAPAGLNPVKVEFEILLHAPALVPFSLVDAHPLSGVAGESPRFERL